MVYKLKDNYGGTIMSGQDLNYYDTFITIAPDSSVTKSKPPVPRGSKLTKPQIEFQLLNENPYVYTQSELLFEVHRQHKEIQPDDEKSEREAFFSKAHACMRASSLPKKLGWGIHFNSEGRGAIYGVESSEYQNFVENADHQLKLLPAIRSSRK